MALLSREGAAETRPPQGQNRDVLGDRRRKTVQAYLGTQASVWVLAQRVAVGPSVRGAASGSRGSPEAAVPGREGPAGAELRNP